MAISAGSVMAPGLHSGSLPDDSHVEAVCIRNLVHGLGGCNGLGRRAGPSPGAVGRNAGLGLRYATGVAPIHRSAGECEEDIMIVVRNIFRLKFGQARPAVALWKEGRDLMNRL